MSDKLAIVRQLRPDDFEQVHQQYSEVYGEQSLSLWRRRFAWQFERNPATRYRPSHLWVAEEAGRVLGFLASFPVRMVVAGREVVTLCPCDLLVSNSARGSGLGRRLVEAYSAATGELAPALQYSPASGRIFRRLGYQAVFAEPVLLRPCDAGALLAFALSRRSSNKSPSGLLRRAILPAAGALGSKAVRILNRVRSPRMAPNLTVDVAAEAGPEFDVLWANLAPCFPAVMVRDRAFIQWRFFDDPLRSHTVLVLRDPEANLLGYAVLTTAVRRGVPFGFLMDLFTDPAAPDLVDALVAGALRSLEGRGVAGLVSLGLDPRLRRRVRHFLYARQRRSELPALLRWHGDQALAPVVYDDSSWHFSYADGDEAFSL
jgi:GNAT superfamily N-acetyltransferase